MFKGAKRLFWTCIINPVYCGKIFLEKYKDEEAQFIKAKHEPIISEKPYYKVQDNFKQKVIGSMYPDLINIFWLSIYLFSFKARLKRSNGRFIKPFAYYTHRICGASFVWW